jgi:hypothetical protein
MRGRGNVIVACALLVGCGSDGTYPTQCGAPLAGWKKPNDGYSALGIANRITLKRDGTIMWNGKEISAGQLSEYSSIAAQLNPVPFTILQIGNGASCATVNEVRRRINDSAKCASEYGSRCGEGPEPWARVGDVIGPNGETYKFYPLRNETVVENSAR